MDWLAKNAALISGVLGLLGSFALAWPLIDEVRDRKFWDLLKGFKASKANSSEETEALRSIRDRLLDERLGGYKKARRFTLGGLFFLALAFVFLMIDAGTRDSRASEVSPPPADGPAGQI